MRPRLGSSKKYQITQNERKMTNNEISPENPYSPPSSDLSVENHPGANRLEGLGGWLVLVGIGVVLSPIRMVSQVLPGYNAMFADGSFAAVTTPGSEAYHPLWAPLLICEIFVNCALVLVWVYIAFQFFGKKARFPALYISVFCFTIAFQVIDAWAFTLVMPGEKMFDAESSIELSRSVIGALIWIPYMLVSKRVKATFVRR